MSALTTCLEHSELTLAEVRRVADAELARLFGPRPWSPGLQPLLTYLAPDRQRPEKSLAEALAEILFVPRPERTEYLQQRSAQPPWDIRRLLLEYALWSARLDRIQAALTKAFCASECPRPPYVNRDGEALTVGCCSIQGYDMGLSTPGLLRAQELEAMAVGWAPPAREEQCTYLGPSGCRLRLFKSPACVGMLCDELARDLGNGRSPGAVAAFLEPLARLRVMVLDREEIFACMAEVATAGEALL